MRGIRSRSHYACEQHNRLALSDYTTYTSNGVNSGSGGPWISLAEQEGKLSNEWKSQNSMAPFGNSGSMIASAVQCVNLLLVFSLESSVNSNRGILSLASPCNVRSQAVPNRKPTARTSTAASLLHRRPQFGRRRQRRRRGVVEHASGTNALRHVSTSSLPSSSPDYAFSSSINVSPPTAPSSFVPCLALSCHFDLGGEGIMYSRKLNEH